MTTLKRYYAGDLAFQAEVYFSSSVDAELKRRDEEMAELKAILQKCDEAMSWDLGGEPLPTLMIEARAAIAKALSTIKGSQS